MATPSAFISMLVDVRICLFMMLLIFVSCQPGSTDGSETENTSAEEQPPTVTLTVDQATGVSGTFDDTQSSGEAKLSGSTEADQWMSFDLDVPVAGRYRTEVVATSNSSTPGVIWIEDYVGNPDDRTYNITGDIEIPANEMSPVAKYKDGSPLNAGKHPIRVHFRNPNIYLQSVTFSLIVEHQKTPETLTQNMDGDEWELVWSDEFNGTGIPDTSNWTFDIGDWGWGNNELQYYTKARTQNARQEGGNLIIEARKNDDGNQWTSARLTTRGKRSFVYGKIEFRAKCPAEKGNWAAGWTLGDAYVDELSWPYCGEIDILESVGYEMDNETGNGTAHASVHCAAYYFKLGNQPTATIDVENMNGAFHTYSVVYSESGLKAYVDDREYFSYSDTSNSDTWPFDQPQNIILNLAMGGGWGGLQGMDESVTSQQFIVDYVRVYGRK